MKFLRRTEVIHGLFFGFLTLIWLLIEMLLGFHRGNGVFWLNYSYIVFSFPAVILMVRNIMIKKKELGGNITFWQAFQSGFFMTLVMIVTALLSQWIFISYINPDYLQELKQYTATEMATSKPEEVTEMFTLGATLFRGIVSTLIMGIASSLIIGGFAKSWGKAKS